MTVPAVEVAIFTASEAYKKDPTVILPALKLLQSISGCVSIWHGLQIQDSSLLYLVIFWETLDHHLVYMNDKEEYPKLGIAMQPAIEKLLGLYHVRFPIDIQPALDAPVTEIAQWTVSEGADLSAFQEKVKALINAAHAGAPNEVFLGGLGEVVEGERKLSVVLGWHSLERFGAAIQSNQTCLDLITELRKLGESELKHANLHKYNKD
ncbi:uncharacterized protein PHACADRAFT_174597 [Phanerochaete carnosa HHB-10118-sp]|uniref:ABM domain-containing protein n=1 Tax=Phanerochaete carnosa (strain HHB-10118-sp) TaxID=650164 RepID=K5UVN5_PHACS|nr:uncharacterized protein PHACADRAFT_174597 [Phanerochaete carnosa HHB-10118-sp]EKM54096.1 hypothetical protein PHACADRAFT_174597 [Phanerochaete carnosa HHB-10118-sp]